MGVRRLRTPSKRSRRVYGKRRRVPVACDFGPHRHHPRAEALLEKKIGTGTIVGASIQGGNRFGSKEACRRWTVQRFPQTNRRRHRPALYYCDAAITEPILSGSAEGPEHGCRFLKRNMRNTIGRNVIDILQRVARHVWFDGRTDQGDVEMSRSGRQNGARRTRPVFRAGRCGDCLSSGLPDDRERGVPLDLDGPPR